MIFQFKTLHTQNNGTLRLTAPGTEPLLSLSLCVLEPSAVVVQQTCAMGDGVPEYFDLGPQLVQAVRAGPGSPREVVHIGPASRLGYA